MMNRLAFDFRVAGYPEEWTLPLKRNPVATELVAYGLLKPLGASAPAGYTQWCFTEKGVEWAKVHTRGC
jgi:hypothetical protein